MNKLYLALIVVVMVFFPFTLISASEDELSTKKETTSFEAGFSKDESKYEIYPVPHSIEYLDEDAFSLQNKVNIVLGDSVDDYTKNFLLDILNEYDINYDITDTANDKTNNIIVDVNEYSDNEVFNKIDAYTLDVEDENIKIVGKDKDSAYYGVATLQMLLSSFANKKLLPVKIEDWAEMEYRGVIEGFYGAWDHEERISLMESSRDVKMNTMVYAAKDDKYHREWWNKLYPQDRIKEMEELVRIGEETKVKFAWSVHLEHFFKGGVSIDGTPEEYEKRYEQLIAKFNQLYDAGIRRFDVMNDDFGSGSDEDVVKLLNRIMTDFVDEKGDVEPIIYTPQGYNVEWASWDGGAELRELTKLDPRVKIYWTGWDVNSPIEQGAIDSFYESTSDKLEPVFWLNYPVNEHAKSGVFLGEISHYARDGVTGLAGGVSNPSYFAETNKVGIFQLASLFWNNQNYSDYAVELWEDSFKYLQPEVYDSYLTIAKNVANAPDSSRVDGFPESEYIKEELEEVMRKIESNESIKDLAEVEKLLQEFKEILFSVEDFRKNVDNERLKKELEPWLKSLVDVTTASKEAIEGVIALEENNVNKAWNNLSTATDAISTWDSNEIFPGDGVVAKSGTKRLYPFVNKLLEQLDAKLLAEFDPQAINILPISSYQSQNLEEMVDGVENTFSYIKIRQENGDWYGIDLGKPVQVDNIEILQGRDDDDHDIFHEGILEYSLDGEDWKAIGEERSGHLIEAEDLNVEARYVRYRLTHAGIPGGKPDLWTAIREFKVNEDTDNIFTNVKELEELELKTSETSAKIESIKDVSLKPTEYVGIELKTIESIKDIEIDLNTSDLTLETSENKVEWTEVADSESYSDATYVRLINKSSEKISFDINKFLINLHKFTDPEVTHNYPGVYEGEPENLFDGNLSSKVWFEGKQDKGKYVEVDMGGIVNVEDVGVVINDGENDFFKEGELQLSMDGETWETIHTFSNPEDRELNFPEHEVPYRYKRVEVDNQNARYVRLLSTGNHSKWLALNQIIVNEGQKLPGKEDLTIEANPAGKDGHEASQSKDQRLSTFYTPQEEHKSGYLNYKLSKETELSDIVILQNPEVISNADVTIRDEDGWHSVGKLDKSLNMFDTSKYENVLEIKLEWDDTTNPQIHEIITMKKQTTDAPEEVADLQDSVDQFEESGDISNDQTIHALNLHLKSVAHFENTGADEKVVKHLNGFKDLLDHYRNEDQISEVAYDSLKEDADTLIDGIN